MDAHWIGVDWRKEGYLVAVTGIVALLMSTWRYFRNMQLLETGKFKPNIHGIVLVVTVVVTAVATAFFMQWNEQRYRQ